MSECIKFALPRQVYAFSEKLSAVCSICLLAYPAAIHLAGCVFVLSVSGILNTPVLTRCTIPRYVPLRMKYSESVPETDNRKPAAPDR